MDKEEVEEILMYEIHYQFPRLTLETVGDILEIVGDGWDWSPDLLPLMKEYIQKGIEIYNKEELIREYGGMFNEDIQEYINALQDKYDCVCWRGTEYDENDNVLEIYVWCD